MIDVQKPKEKKLRGFACMPKEKLKELARKGGAAVPASKRSFSLNKNLASRAGVKGGSSVPASRRTYFTDRVLAAKAGKKGGEAPKQKRGDGE